ncbi:MAG: hypothetical protein IJG37_01345 [Synergistaceae bacterium]|nr:hypothetical protein [Synergistaceae bacterium]
MIHQSRKVHEWYSVCSFTHFPTPSALHGLAVSLSGNISLTAEAFLPIL